MRRQDAFARRHLVAVGLAGFSWVALWSVALPRFLLLDPLALAASSTRGLLAAGIGTLAALVLTALRLRDAGARQRLPYRTGLDVGLLGSAAAIAQWTASQLDARVPYIESFSVLFMQTASAGAAAVAVYIASRRLLRRYGAPRGVRPPPGVRAVFAAGAAVLGLVGSVLLGFGAAGRSAGALDREQAERLGEIADLLAVVYRHIEDDAARTRLLLLLEAEPATRAEVLSHGEVPLLLQAAHAPGADSGWAVADLGDRLVVLDGRARWHLLRRPTVGGTLWLSAPANVRPPVRSPDEAPAMLAVALLVLIAPLAASLVGQDLREQLDAVTHALRALGPARLPQDAVPLIPVPTVDEVGDLAVALNRACRRFAEDNRRLADELHAADADDRARSRFMAAASHDLRTPLASIIGYGHILQGGGTLNPAQRENVDLVVSAGAQLLAHLDEILDLSRIEAGREAPLALEPLDLAALAAAVCHARGGAERRAARISGEEAAADTTDPKHAGAPGVRLIVHPAPSLSRVHADRQRIRQVIENLVSNALKFTRVGTVDVSLSAWSLQPGRPAVRLTVRDTGPGIPPDELELVFQEFHRVGSQRDVVGTGLGLAIARRLVAQHGGRLSVESEVGVGSAFHLDLPVEGPTEEALALSARLTPAGVREPW